ncbi:MAG: methyltransferase domain-containing protein [Clostridiales bacterium]|nr:methyltransferase domain-containing protein [Clostridiales bacterium]
MKLKIAELRKGKGISQQELADVLGISFQAISKWETNVSLPDITMLPKIAEYFDVSVDELLGLKPLKDELYIPSETGTKDYWSERLEYIKRSRSSFWNVDYMQFLIEKVWGINKPINVLDCGCGYGFLGDLLLPILPRGSTYTGIDFSEKLIKYGKEYFETKEMPIELICDDVINHISSKRYDFVISQAVLRHLNNPLQFLSKMISFANKGGIIVCIEVNREFENGGLYIEGMDYGFLCEQPGFRTMWKNELETQGRDYSIGMKVPDMMKQLGLKNIDIRMNDKVSYVSPDSDGYLQKVSDFIEAKGFNMQRTLEDNNIDHFMNHGMDRKKAEAYCIRHNKISSFIDSNPNNLTYTHLYGLLISYGIK